MAAENSVQKSRVGGCEPARRANIGPRIKNRYSVAQTTPRKTKRDCMATLLINKTCNTAAVTLVTLHTGSFALMLSGFRVSAAMPMIGGDHCRSATTSGLPASLVKEI